MGRLRVSLWAALALVLLIVAAWSIVGLFSQVVSVSVTRAEKQLRAGFNSIHLGHHVDGLSGAKPGIPLEPNRSQIIGGRPLIEWLRLSQAPNDGPINVRDVHAINDEESRANIPLVPMTTNAKGTTIPVASQESGPPIVLILIPPKGVDSLSVQWAATPRQNVSENLKPTAIPAFGASEHGE
jgi:hypothetical protein